MWQTPDLPESLWSRASHFWSSPKATCSTMLSSLHCLECFFNDVFMMLIHSTFNYRLSHNLYIYMMPFSNSKIHIPVPSCLVSSDSPGESWKTWRLLDHIPATSHVPTSALDGHPNCILCVECGQMYAKNLLQHPIHGYMMVYGLKLKNNTPDTWHILWLTSLRLRVSTMEQVKTNIFGRWNMMPVAWKEPERFV